MVCDDGNNNLTTQIVLTSFIWQLFREFPLFSVNQITKMRLRNFQLSVAPFPVVDETHWERGGGEAKKLATEYYLVLEVNFKFISKFKVCSSL